MPLLPETKTTPTTDPNKLTYLIYGPSGIGKTTFCSKLDAALFLDTEKGSKLQNVYSVPIPDWSTFQKVIDEITTRKHQFKNIIIDTVGKLVTYCTRHCCDKYGITHPSEAEWGKGWDLIKKEFDYPINRLQHSGFGVWFVSHENVRLIKNPLGNDYDFTETDLPNFLKKAIQSLCDYTFFCVIEQQHEKDQNGKIIGIKTSRIIKTKPAKNYLAKDRTVNSPLPETLPLDTAEVIAALAKHLKINSEISANG